MRLHARSGDRASAVRVYQSCIRVLESELGAEVSAATREAYEQLVSLSAAPLEVTELARKPKSHNLPVQATSFVGREREIADIKRLLSIGSGTTMRLITLVGAGGCGKTRLAIQVAA